MAGRQLLNPCDYLILGQHLALARRRQGGNVAYMTVDIRGEVDPRLAQSALAAALRRTPPTFARLGFTPVGGRACWRWCDSPAAVAAAAARAYHYADLTGDADAASRLTGFFDARYSGNWPMSVGPQVSLEHYALPDRRSRFILRWPHCLMDAEGAQRFLADVASGGTPLVDVPADQPPPPPILGPVGEPVDPLREYSWAERLRLARCGLRLQGRHRGLEFAPLVRASGVPFRGHAAVHRHFDAQETQRIQTHARNSTPPGAGLYTRYLAACVLRAVDRVYQSLTTQSPAYCITLPDRVTLADRRTGGPVPRPLHGNYLVSPVVAATREEVADFRRLGETLQRQVTEYRAAQGDLCQWALLWTASFLHATAQRVLLSLPLGFERLSSGFSCYREVDPPLRTFLGAEVLDLYGGGPLPTPPGWNPVFSRFGDRLTLSLSWNRPAIPDEVAHRYLRYIEEECLTPR